MKIEDVARPGVLALGIVGVAATALLGFAAGVAVARDPAVLRRTVRGLARSMERATLLAAQAREHVEDLWAEAREEALAEVDAADFERAATSAATAAPETMPGKATHKRTSRSRKAITPRKSATVNAADLPPDQA
ncbi:hypothetical protein [Hydrogenophaga sp.]|uniref:hypothetical protein n=1 Tax=Hydrogenophaga sp. TaxID=1904254 RepID=UPI002629335F|nr:hypothetical protein [Hydrogenophaga sp.]MDM7950846.1 hypothetical protein [Hydrogenophaga sp.]